MVDVDRLPIVGLVIFMLVAALIAGGYAVGRATVATPDEAASARDVAYRFGYRAARHESQPEARSRGRKAGARAGYLAAREVINDFFQAQRLRDQKLDAKQAVAERDRRATAQSADPSFRRPVHPPPGPRRSVGGGSPAPGRTGG